MVLYPNKLPESERVCSGICSQLIIDTMSFASGKDEARQLIERYCK